MLVARFILLLSVIKWRKLAKIVFYFETSVQIVEAFLPLGTDTSIELTI